MAIYWRLKDIPELHDVPEPRNRRLWSEAITRSFTVRYFVITLFALMSCAVLLAEIAHLLWPTNNQLIMLGLVGIPVGGVINQFTVTQFRARRWLRKHAAELDRYVAT